MEAKVAIIGRVNTGKSTLFNRLIGEQRAIHKNEPGVTRDKLIGKCEWNGYTFDVIDTGGFMPEKEITEIYAEIKEQIQATLQEVDAIIFLLDGKVGLHPGDKELSKLIRAAKKKVFPVVNKIDVKVVASNLGEFWELGFDNFYSISAEHSIDIDELLDDLVSYLKEVVTETEEDLKLETGEKIYRLAIVGRRNAGKSTLFNQLFGKKRVIVSSIPGTTRDPIEEIIQIGEKKFTLIDTAGFFRKRKIKTDIEFYSYIRSYRAIQKADIVLFVMDSTDPITREDKQILSFIEENKKASLFLLNKVDLWDKKASKHDIEEFIKKQMPFVYAPIIPLSAKTGQNFKLFFRELENLVERFEQTLPQREIIEFLKELFIINPPPLGKRKKIVRFKFARIDKMVPFILTLYLNDAELPEHYISYIKNELRKTYNLEGVPIIVKINHSHVK
jgi:GTP-binding protein